MGQETWASPSIRAQAQACSVGSMVQRSEVGVASSALTGEPGPKGPASGSNVTSSDRGWPGWEPGHQSPSGGEGETQRLTPHPTDTSVVTRRSQTQVPRQSVCVQHVPWEAQAFGWFVVHANSVALTSSVTTRGGR